MSTTAPASVFPEEVTSIRPSSRPSTVAPKRRTRQEEQIGHILGMLGEGLDPEHNPEFINNFPNLVVAADGEFDILAGERERYRGAMRRVAQAHLDARRHDPNASPVRLRELQTLAGRRAVFDLLGSAYRLGDFEDDYPKFTQAILAARSTITWLIEKYFSSQHRPDIEMRAEVEAEEDPYELLKLCSVRGDDIGSRRIRFEAARQLTLAQIYFEMDRQGDSRAELDRDLADMERELKAEYFLPQRSTTFEIKAELDPENQYRVKHLECKEGDPQERSKSTETCVYQYPPMRFISGNVPVLQIARVKENAVLKLLSKNQREPYAIHDLCGVKFVFLDLDSLNRGIRALRDRVVIVPGTVTGQASNLSRSGVVNPRNINSAEEARFTKYRARKFDRWFEFQFELMQDYLNEKFSIGRENHELYKLRLLIQVLLPKLFPSSLYLDWTDPSIRKSLIRFRLAEIWS